MAVVATGGAIAVLLLANGVYDSHPTAALKTATGRRAAPGWTRPCWGPARRATFEDACQRVRGRVVLVENEDPDGDGDRHLVLVARLHVRIVKLDASFPVRRLPRIGSEVSATGLVLTGSSGKAEIRASRFRTGGRTVVEASAG